MVADAGEMEPQSGAKWFKAFRRQLLGQLKQLRQTGNEKSQSNLGRAASPPLTVENNYATKSALVTIRCLTFTHKNAPSLRRSYHDTPFLRPTALTTPNGIQIQSAVFPQFIHRTDRPTDRQAGRQTNRWDRRQVFSNSRLRCIDCIPLANN